LLVDLVVLRIGLVDGNKSEISFGAVVNFEKTALAAGTEPPGFRDNSAEEVFRAASDIVDLISPCREKLPMSALVLFAVLTAAFVGVYAICFPYMDAKRYMLPAEDEGPIQGDYTTSPATSLAYTTLKQMSNWLRMAEAYVEYSGT